MGNQLSVGVDENYGRSFVSLNNNRELAISYNAPDSSYFSNRPPFLLFYDGTNSRLLAVKNGVYLSKVDKRISEVDYRFFSINEYSDLSLIGGFSNGTGLFLKAKNNSQEYVKSISVRGDHVKGDNKGYFFQELKEPSSINNKGDIAFWSSFYSDKEFPYREDINQPKNS